MNTQQNFPPEVHRIDIHETFNFDCRPENVCFTDCCRQLELALSPYDVLRLCQATGLGSNTFLEQYVIIEKEENDVFPRFYLSMVDDGRESCVFVSPRGCTVYEHRPGACRTYPMGRASIRQEEGWSEFFVLLKENHCMGFLNNAHQTPTSYSQNQKLEPYNQLNDAWATITQHEKVRSGISFTDEQINFYTLALYNLDLFRIQITTGNLKNIDLNTSTKHKKSNNEELLIYGIEWLKTILFNVPG